MPQVAVSVIGGEFAFPTPLSNPDAAIASRSGLFFPCDAEVKAVVGKIAEAFGGTVDESGGSFQIDLPTPTISYDTMEKTMKDLGFKTFFNENLRRHWGSWEFGFGAYHWEGNVLGNWYHLNFPRARWMSSQVTLAKDLHYEPDRPEDYSHRVPNARNEREPCP